MVRASGSLRTVVTVIVSVSSLSGDELGHAVDAAAPQLLVLVEQAAREAEPLDVGPDDLAPPDALLGHEAGPLEHRDVLLDRGEAHRVVPGELRDALARR